VDSDGDAAVDVVCIFAASLCASAPGGAVRLAPKSTITTFTVTEPRTFVVVGFTERSTRHLTIANIRQANILQQNRFDHVVNAAVVADPGLDLNSENAASRKFGSDVPLLSVSFGCFGTVVSSKYIPRNAGCVAIQWTNTYFPNQACKSQAFAKRRRCDDLEVPGQFRVVRPSCPLCNSRPRILRIKSTPDEPASRQNKRPKRTETAIYYPLFCSNPSLSSNGDKAKKQKGLNHGTWLNLPLKKYYHILEEAITRFIKRLIDLHKANSDFTEASVQFWNIKQCKTPPKMEIKWEVKNVFFFAVLRRIFTSSRNINSNWNGF
jgi:hypothetical protein